MSKKKKKEMDKHGKEFVKGAVERGIQERKARKIFDLMAFFSGYGFNKSHSAAYAMLSMKTAWLKAHHPAAFMAAAMTSDMGDTNRLIVLLEECRNLGIPVQPPDVNSGDVGFGLKDGGITYGLAAVKNMGEKAVSGIVEVRSSGPFADLYDFCSRVDPRLVNRRVMENLIQSGAMDSLPGTRSCKMASLDRIMACAQKKQIERDRGQTFLGFSDSSASGDAPALDDAPPWDESERLHREKESLGFYFSGHPLDRYSDIMRRILNVDSVTLPDKKDRDQVVLAGLITEVKVISDRKGNPMAFVTMEDFYGSFETIVFASCYETRKGELIKDNLIVVSGKVSVKDKGETKIIADKVYSMDDAVRYLSRSIHLTLREGLFGEEQLAGLHEIIERHSGERNLVFHWKRNGSTMYTIRSRTAGVSPGLELFRELKTLSGVENVEVSS
jgi:DNA polymerase-3 subunit alpha